MDDAIKKYLKWRIDELNPEQVRKVIRYVAGLLAAEKEIKNAPVTDQSTQGAKNNHLQDTTEE
ncbi:hypothetical protein DSECCO2_206570 [anaerobic digester metagenome]